MTNLSELELQSSDDGVMLTVKAQPGARQNAIRGIHAGALRVAVTQVAEKGKANRAIVALLAKRLGIPKSQITLVSGGTASIKKFRLDGIAAEQLRAKLREVSEE